MTKSAVVTLLQYALGVGLLAWVVWHYWQPIDDEFAAAFDLHLIPPDKR